jgi:hypothetical protein
MDYKSEAAKARKEAEEAEAEFVTLAERKLGPSKWFLAEAERNVWDGRSGHASERALRARRKESELLRKHLATKPKK